MWMFIVCQCGSRLNVPATYSSKQVKCRKCNSLISVPTITDEFVYVDEAGFEIVDEPKAFSKNFEESQARVVMDDGSDLPLAKPIRSEDNNLDSKPLKEEAASEPKTKPRAQIGSRRLIVAIIAVGLLIPICLVSVLISYVFHEIGFAVNTASRKAPAGFSDVGNASVGIRVFLPGLAKGHHPFVHINGNPGVTDYNNYSATTNEFLPRGVLSANRSPGFRHGTDEKSLERLFDNKPRFGLRIPIRYEVTKRQMFEVDGRNQRTQLGFCRSSLCRSLALWL